MDLSGALRAGPYVVGAGHQHHEIEPRFATAPCPFRDEGRVRGIYQAAL